MSVTHPSAIRNLVADFVVDQLDLSSPPGQLIMQSSGGATVATLVFSNPAFGAAASGTATAGALAADTNAIGGTITKAELRQGGGTPIILCSVSNAGGGGDIQLSSNVVSAGQTVSLSSLTYSAPP